MWLGSLFRYVCVCVCVYTHTHTHKHTHSKKQIKMQATHKREAIFHSHTVQHICPPCAFQTTRSILVHLFRPIYPLHCGANWRKDIQPKLSLKCSQTTTETQKINKNHTLCIYMAFPSIQRVFTGYLSSNQ